MAESNDVIKEGPIMKRGVFSWHNRWLALFSSELILFKEKGVAAKGSLLLSDTRIKKRPNEPLRFTLLNEEGRKYDFRTNTPQEKVDWIRAIRDTTKKLKNSRRRAEAPGSTSPRETSPPFSPFVDQTPATTNGSQRRQELYSSAPAPLQRSPLNSSRNYQQTSPRPYPTSPHSNSPHTTAPHSTTPQQTQTSSTQSHQKQRQPPRERDPKLDQYKVSYKQRYSALFKDPQIEEVFSTEPLFDYVSILPPPPPQQSQIYTSGSSSQMRSPQYARNQRSHIASNGRQSTAAYLAANSAAANASRQRRQHLSFREI